MIKHIFHAIIISAITTLLIGLIAVTVAHIPTKVPNSSAQKFSNAEISHIEKQLIQKCADDCILEPVESGYKCREIKTGKVYKINKI